MLVHSDDLKATINNLHHTDQQINMSKATFSVQSHLICIFSSWGWDIFNVTTWYRNTTDIPLLYLQKKETHFFKPQKVTRIRSLCDQAWGWIDKEGTETAGKLKLVLLKHGKWSMTGNTEHLSALCLRCELIISC